MSRFQLHFYDVYPYSHFDAHLTAVVSLGPDKIAILPPVEYMESESDLNK